ncbi:MAG: rRNA maturation RNase YbeY [Acidobacteriota bacterium]
MVPNHSGSGQARAWLHELMPGAAIFNRQRKHRVAIGRLERFCVALLKQLKTPDAEFSLLLTSDRTIRRYNRDYRHQDKATDVLSFPTDRSAEDPDFRNAYIGDMIVSVETAQRQASVRKHSLETELKTLIIHGVLHLLGYDHETDRGQMGRKEARLRHALL